MNKVEVRQGYLGKGHYYIICPFKFINPAFDLKSVVNREVEAWEKSNEIAGYLYQNVAEFKNAFLTNSSYQLNGLYAPQMVDSDYARERPCLRTTVLVRDEKITLNSFATPYSNLFSINEAAVLKENQTNYLKTPAGAFETASILSEKIKEFWSLLASENAPEILKEDHNSISDGVGIKEKFSPQTGKPYERIRVLNENIPVIDEMDILVAGGGTSGAPATYISAREGKKTMVIDMNPGFGGTGTYGGVHSYWGPGNYYGFTLDHIYKTMAVNKSFSRDFPAKRFGFWSIQAKMTMWLNEIRDADAQIIWNSFVIGTIMLRNKAIGVVISSPQGVFAVKSKMVIDATGDADAAAFAGAPFVFGSEYNKVPLWYALRSQAEPGPTKSVFQSTVDVTNIEDYTRSVHVGLRTGGEDLHDHQPYLAPRESRHITGEAVTTLTDNLTFREWEDVINIHRSNTDMKGYHASDWFRIGLIPPNLSIEIPYRAMIPQNVENLIVAGKAISTTHDSSAAVRMQHDLETLGGVAALAAVSAIDENVMARDIDIRKFQRKLINFGLLPARILEREIKPAAYSAEEIREWIKQFEPDVSLKSYGNTEMSEIRYARIPFVEVCASPPEPAIPVLNEELNKSLGNRQLQIALALAMHGSESGAEIIYNEINNQIKGSLPVLTEPVQHSGGNSRTPPDQGAAPGCANLIYALGMTRSHFILPAIKRVSENFSADSINDFRERDRALFFYVDAVCYAADLAGNKKAIPFLQKIHKNKFLNNRSLKAGIESNHILERLSLMELILGRALARSGSEEGYQILIEYLDDMRAVLAEFAHNALVKITDLDYGKDKGKWSDWLEKNINKLEPVSLKVRPFD